MLPHRAPRLRNFTDPVLAFWRASGLKGIAFCWRDFKARRQPQCKVHEELRKAAIRRSGWIALARCWVHILPLCSTTSLLAINLHGLYVGGDWEGPHYSFSPQINVLTLQGTAKLIELLIVASLSTIVADIVRRKLIYDSLPFGLIAVHIRLTEVSYFWSPDFWYAQSAIQKLWKRVRLTSFIILCGLVAVAAGPSSAVLLIPSTTDHWPAGSCEYYIAGNDSYLWPETLDDNAVGISWHSTCLDPPADRVTKPWPEFGDSSCIWGGYSSLRSAYRDAMGFHVDNLTVTDSAVTRTLQRIISWPAYSSPYTLAPNVGVTAPSYYLGLSWIKSIQAIRGVSSFSHYKRQPGFPEFRMESYVPIVRTACMTYENYTFTDPRAWQYPFLPESGPQGHLNYSLAPSLISNSSSANARWREPPQGASVLSNGSSTDYYPSTFLDVQIPHNHSQTGAVFWACSVDARWIRTDNVGMGFNDHIKSSYSVFGAQPNKAHEFPFTLDTRPEYGAVKMTPQWLSTLTPSVNGDPAYTTLSALLDPLTNWYSAQTGFTSEVESIIATVIAEGMSRIGYSRNGGGYTIPSYATKVYDRYELDKTNFMSTVFEDQAILPPPTTNDPFDDVYDYSNSTKIKWKVSISGYYYRADGAAKYFSLVVLLIHAILALAHLLWLLAPIPWRKIPESSDAWDSVPELVALAQNSQPTARLSNTSAGISCGGTMAQQARVRAVRRRAEDHAATTGRYAGEQLQLLFDDHDENDRTSAQLVVDERYGRL